MNLYVKLNQIKIRHIIGMVLISMVIAIITAIAMNINDSNFDIIDLEINVILIITLIYKLKPSREEMILLYQEFKQKLKLKEIFSVVGTQICLSMGTVLLLIGTIYIFSPSLINDLLNEDNVVSGNNFALSFLSVVIMAPIVEELIFRGVIFKRLSKKFNIYIGLVVSSIIFGSLHLELGIIGAIIFGMANCVLYIKYKNILIPMLVHFLNNLLVTITQMPFGSASNESEIFNLTSSDLIICFIIGGILFFIGTFIFVRFINKNKSYLKEYNIGSFNENLKQSNQ